MSDFEMSDGETIGLIQSVSITYDAKTTQTEHTDHTEHTDQTDQNNNNNSTSTNHPHSIVQSNRLRKLQENGIRSLHHKSLRPTPYQSPPLSGVWLHSDRQYSTTSSNKLPRRVNHASAFQPGGDKIYILGGFHQFSKHANYQHAAELDCYEFDCLTQKTRTIKHPRNVQAELVSIEQSEKGKPLNFALMRYGLQAVLLNNKIYLYGGVADAEVLRQYIFWINFADVFCLDLNKENPEYENITQTDIERFFMDSLSIGPAVRDGHSIAPLPEANSFIIFGGYVHSIEKMCNDLWIFSANLNKWFEVKLKKAKKKYDVNNYEVEHEPENSSKTEPRGRDFSTLVVIGEDLMLYGGRSFNAGDEDQQDESNSVYDENVWLIKGLFSGLGKGETEEDFDNMQRWAENNCAWKALNGKGKNDGVPEVGDSKLLVPTARRSHMVFVRHDSMYLTGGVDKDDIHHNDIWKFDLKNEIWEKVQNYRRVLVFNSSLSVRIYE